MNINNFFATNGLRTFRSNGSKDFSICFEKKQLGFSEKQHLHFKEKPASMFLNGFKNNWNDEKNSSGG